MENQYKQLTLVEKYQIEALNKSNYSGREIAKVLNRSNKTISDELKRCQPYCALTANTQAERTRRELKQQIKFVVYSYSA